MGMRKITKTGGVIITTSPNEIKLDHQIKKVLACKPILSRILQKRAKSPLLQVWDG